VVKKIEPLSPFSDSRDLDSRCEQAQLHAGLGLRVAWAQAQSRRSMNDEETEEIEVLFTERF
jgi:hypothetical protein